MRERRRDSLERVTARRLRCISSTGQLGCELLDADGLRGGLGESGIPIPLGRNHSVSSGRKLFRQAVEVRLRRCEPLLTLCDVGIAALLRRRRPPGKQLLAELDRDRRFADRRRGDLGVETGREPVLRSEDSPVLSRKRLRDRRTARKTEPNDDLAERTPTSSLFGQRAVQLLGREHAALDEDLSQGLSRRCPCSPGPHLGGACAGNSTSSSPDHSISLNVIAGASSLIPGT